MRTLQVVPIIVGLLEGVAKNFDKLGIKIIFHCLKMYVTRKSKDSVFPERGDEL